MNLDTLLHPLGWAKFEQSYFRKQPVVLTGPASRFSPLVTTDKLNAVLNTHRFTPRRLSFVSDGSSAPRDAYLWNFKEEDALVRADGVKQLIDQGYHLTLNGVDELWSDVREIAEAWEHAVGSYVAVNLYGVWAGQHGFKIHTDGHDTLLLQVDGTKHWLVYAPDADIDKTLEIQKAEPTLSCALRPGHLLYIPKGWWHVGHAENGHSVHLTVGVEGDPTSLFVQWCVREWQSRAWAARPLPWPDTAGNVNAFLAELADALRGELTIDAFRRFRQWKETNTAVRPRVDIQSDADAARLDDDALIRWRSHAQFSIVPDSAEASLTIDGWTMAIPLALVPAVRRIRTWPAIAWRELSATVAPDRSVSLLENWISAMVLGGHLAVESTRTSSRQSVATHG